MARKSEFYKGRRKKRSYAFIPFVIVLAIITFIVVNFYGMQKYAVVTKDGVSVELPILGGSNSTGPVNSNRVYEPVDAPLVLDPPDYSKTEIMAVRDVPPLRAIYVAVENITEEKLAEYTERLNVGNALVLEMKPRNGRLMFTSSSEAAAGYGLSMPPEQSDEIQRYIDKLKEQGVYLVAQISCCLDETYPARNISVGLKNAYGTPFMDADGVWLDPYNLDVRKYTAQLCEDLYAMGFDEVVLSELRHPIIEMSEEEKKALDELQRPAFVYTRDMSTKPEPVTAVCGFAVSVADMLRDRGEDKLLSVYTYTPPSLVKPDTGTGQDATLFMKIFDRVYYPTDKFAYTYNVDDIRPSVLSGRVEDRFVPVVINMLPANPESVSWVLIDQEVEEEED